jgi:hypothetical protein
MVDEIEDENWQTVSEIGHLVEFCRLHAGKLIFLLIELINVRNDVREVLVSHLFIRLVRLYHHVGYSLVMLVFPFVVCRSIWRRSALLRFQFRPLALGHVRSCNFSLLLVEGINDSNGRFRRTGFVVTGKANRRSDFFFAGDQRSHELGT